MIPGPSQHRISLAWRASADRMLPAAPGVALVIAEAPDGLSLAPGPLPLAEVTQTVTPSAEVANAPDQLGR